MVPFFLFNGAIYYRKRLRADAAAAVHRTMCHLDPGDHAEAIGDPTARAPARQGPSRDARQLGIHKNFKGMKSTPFGTPVTTTHDESTSVTYIRT